MKKRKYLFFCISYFILLSFFFFLSSCNQPGEEDAELEKSDEEPRVEGFDYSKSDSSAVSIANQVLKAMGGRKNWNRARFFTWNFFGEQRHFWDKKTGDIRIESLGSNLIILMNVNTKKGKVFVNGEEITQADSLNKYMEMGEEMWANDSYWLVMPFQLITSGNVLKYLDEDVAQTGETADVIEVTSTQGSFADKKFHVYVDKNSHFVIQWALYSKAENEDPTFVTGWSDYEKYHNIWLAGTRGRFEITQIAIADSFPPNTFITPQPVAVY